MVESKKAYCFRCRKKVEMKEPREITLKNRAPATKGRCVQCGGEVYRTGPK